MLPCTRKELLVLWESELHRDVRVALLRALWPYAEREQTWEIFTRAAQAPEVVDEAIATALIKQRPTYVEINMAIWDSPCSMPQGAIVFP